MPPHVQVLLRCRAQEVNADNIYDEADEGDQQRRSALDLRRVAESFVSFVEDVERDADQHDRIRE